MSARAAEDLGKALADQAERLLPCVHCGFCLPACPTYRRLGDENDSPRGRLHLMRAVVEGRLEPDSEAFRTHIDRCLGCRACEPVCPSGVEYGSLLELARASSGPEGRGRLARVLLAVMAGSRLRRAAMLAARGLRATRLPALVARLGGDAGPPGPVRLGAAMLAASAPGRLRMELGRGERTAREQPGSHRTESPGPAPVRQDPMRGKPGGSEPAEPAGPEPATRGRVAVLAGCVQAGLFGRVGAASARTLEVNGYNVVRAKTQCCGALHAHAGSLEAARALARANMEAFEAVSPDWIAVDAAGCGAAMKDYGELFSHDPAWRERARAFSELVRDVTELLAESGPVRGGALPVTAAYDHPCHLLHAQGVRETPLRVLDAVPGLTAKVVADADECCGGAGIYGITQRELGWRIGTDKTAAVLECNADLVVTANPGCAMQIGAGLRLTGHPSAVAHPVEILDESYRRAGFYEHHATRPQ